MYMPTGKIDEWVMVVYEQQRRFDQRTATEVVKGLREAADAVGSSFMSACGGMCPLLTHLVRRAHQEGPRAARVSSCSR